MTIDWEAILTPKKKKRAKKTAVKKRASVQRTKRAATKTAKTAKKNAAKTAKKNAAKTKETKAEKVEITAPKFQTVLVKIRGTSPYVQHRFGQKAFERMRQQQAEGQTAKIKKAKRKPKDFEAYYRDAMHISTEGWIGISAAAFRNAMISACRVAGYVMKTGKLVLFVDPDGFDKVDGTPLVKITKGTPRKHEMPLPNDNGKMDIRVRPMWAPGWECQLKIRFDADQISLNSVLNLLMRAGLQVGVGEGRHDSKKANGLGWGCFEIVR